MTKTAETSRRFVILDSNGNRYRQYLGDAVYLCRTADEISEVFAKRLPCLTWVSYSRKFTDDLLKTAVRQRGRSPAAAARCGECVLMVTPPRAESVPSLHGMFPNLVGDSPSYRWLSKSELTEVLLNPLAERSELIIAAAADVVTKTLSLVRGNCQQLVVPFSIFAPAGDGTQPDFSKLNITDYGRTIALGAYEASTDVILYETDLEYRQKVNGMRRESDRSFGASLLRLRKERRLKRADFAPLSAKTIARLERNEIEKPHGKTLQIIADRLGVPEEEIESY